MVTANMNKGKMNTKNGKVCVFLSFLKPELLDSHVLKPGHTRTGVYSGFCTIPGKNVIQIAEGFSPASKAKENSTLNLLSFA